MFKFQEASFTSKASEVTFSEAGTLAENAVGMSLKFSKKNLKNLEKKVTLLLKDEEGNNYFLPCTTPLSESVRAAIAKGKSHKEILSALQHLTIIVNDEDGKYFLNAPDGGSGFESFKIEDLDDSADFSEVLGGY